MVIHSIVLKKNFENFDKRIENVKEVMTAVIVDHHRKREETVPIAFFKLCQGQHTTCCTYALLLYQEESINCIGESLTTCTYLANNKATMRAAILFVATVVGLTTAFAPSNNNEKNIVPIDLWEETSSSNKRKQKTGIAYRANDDPMVVSSTSPINNGVGLIHPKYFTGTESNGKVVAEHPHEWQVLPPSAKSLRTMNPIRAIVDPIVANIKSGEERGDGKNHISLGVSVCDDAYSIFHRDSESSHTLVCLFLYFFCCWHLCLLYILFSLGILQPVVIFLPVQWHLRRFSKRFNPPPTRLLDT